MVPRLATLTFVLALIGPPAVALERLEWPGGADALRRVTNMPPHVPDDMLLVEVVRTWYGAPDPLLPPSSLPARLIDHVRTSTDDAAPGPALPMPPAVWSGLLRVNEGRDLALALLARRDAMLLYHGLMGMDEQTLGWIATRRELLNDLLGRAAAAFASAAPSIRIDNGAVAVPGGINTAPAWGRLVDATPAQPDEFIRKLMERRNGRIAWLFSVLASLDAAQLRFAIGERGEGLEALARHFVNASPEWSLVERPFWRPAFDPSLPLLLSEPNPDGAVHGSEEFWRHVFDDSTRQWNETRSTPLTGPALLDLLIGSEPHRTRERWIVFAHGQRLFARVPPSRDAWLALRESHQFAALRVSLERAGVNDPALQLALYQAAGRLASRDNGGSGGELAAWQGATALVEQAMLRGGLSAAEAQRAYRALASMPMSAPRAEVTRWLLDDLVPGLLARRGAAPSAERTVLRTIAGVLTADGPRVPPRFQWEDLKYAFVPHDVASRNMEIARAAQGGASVDDALVAWRSGGDAGRRKAEEIVARILPALAYAPHQAATEVPSLGADIAFRHEFVSPEEGPSSHRRRPWLVPRGNSHGHGGWHLEGSLLGLDLALHQWYVHRHGEPPAAAPAMDEPDLETMQLANVLAMTEDVSSLELDAALADVEKGKEAAARLDPERLDAALGDAGVDGWRRRAIRLQASSGGPRLTLAETWRLGGGAGRLVARWPLDGCACLGSVPRTPVVYEGRRSAGLLGSLAPDLALRVAAYLRAQKLPLVLFGELMASAVVDVMHGAQGVRPDDRLALAVTASSITDARLEEHLLALVGTGAMGRP